ncbi:MAG TPA: hypothetical protein VHE78_10555 [Gemmatimonadaceae bacterium]|nr:hypothetical protein [Gemmatimonadaceae bacterium]
MRLEPGVTSNREGGEFPFAAFPALPELLKAQRERTATLERKDSVSGRLVHDLRRTGVRNLERAGVSRSVAMKLTGHKTEAVYRRYAITSAADLRECVGKLSALHDAPVGSPSVVPITSALHSSSTIGRLSSTRGVPRAT